MAEYANPMKMNKEKKIPGDYTKNEEIRYYLTISKAVYLSLFRSTDSIVVEILKKFSTELEMG